MLIGETDILGSVVWLDVARFETVLTTVNERAAEGDGATDAEGLMVCVEEWEADTIAEELVVCVED